MSQFIFSLQLLEFEMIRQDNEQISKQSNNFKCTVLLLLYNILAFIPFPIAVLTHCQMNENPCSNQEIHM